MTEGSWSENRTIPEPALEAHWKQPTPTRREPLPVD